MNPIDPVTENVNLEKEVETLKQNGWPADRFTTSEALRLATGLRNGGNRQLAQEVLTRALANFPDNAQFFNEQGRLYCDFKKYDQAVEWFDKTIKKKPKAEDTLRIAAFTGAGMALRNLRRFDEALEMLRQALQASGQTASAPLLLEQGWLAFYQKSYAEAFTRFQQAADQLPENEQHEARVGLLASCRQLDVLSAPYGKDSAKELVSGWQQTNVDPDEVINIFVDCSDFVLEHLNLYPAALRNAEHLIEIAEDNSDGVYYKIAALKWLRRYAAAEETYLAAPPELQTDPDIWKERANSFYEQKQFFKAYLHYSGKVLDQPNATDAEKELKDLLQDDLDAREWTIVSLRKMRRLEEARNEVNAALSEPEFKNKLNLLSELAAIHYAERDYDNAIKLYERALEIDDYDTFALQWRTASLRKKGNLPAAKLALNKALSKVPYAARLWDERGWFFFDQGNFEEALNAFDTAIQLDPYLVNKQFAKVETLLRLNHSDQALEVFKNLEQQFPNDAEVSEQLCWFYIRMGQLELAWEQQTKLRESYPDSALGWNALGGYELKQRNFGAAAEAFREAIAIVDYEPQYYVNLAFALIRQVKPSSELSRSELPKRDQLIEEARSHCRAALKLDPYNAKAYGCLGVIAFELDAFLDAESYFRKSIEVNPSEGSYVELGSLYSQMGCYDKAAATLKKALEINPNDALAYIELGNVAVWKEDNKQAVRYCREAIHAEPKNPDTYRALAIALMRAEQYDEAEGVVRKGLRALAPAKPWRLNLLLAQILVHLGDIANKDRKKKDLDLYEEALVYVNEAKQSHAPHADILFHSGIVQYRLEDFSTSQKNFSDCVKLNRDRYDADRNSRIVQAAIKQQRRLFKVNKSYSVILTIVCILFLAILWFSYFRGYKRTIMVNPPPAANNPAPTPVPKEEFMVDQPLLNVMTPILLGLLTIAALLPNLSKLKLPGFEAEITEPKPTDPNISAGPRGDIGFGTSLPIIDPEPR